MQVLPQTLLTDGISIDDYHFRDQSLRCLTPGR